MRNHIAIHPAERLTALTSRPATGWVPDLDPGVWPDSTGPPDPTTDGWPPIAPVAETDRRHPPPGRRWARLTQALPELLRGVRLDPGRRAATALVALAGLAALITIALVWRSRPAPIPVRPVAAQRPAFATAPVTPGGSAGPRPVATSVATPVVVAVAGRVRRPGLVRLPAGSRVADALAAAGGLVPGTSVGLLNLAARLDDGEQVVVGVPGAGSGVNGEAAGGTDSPAGGSGAAGPSAPVNLNTATADELDSLPGVGPSTAQKILQWRAANGPFHSIDQLQDVSGIGPKKFASLEPDVTV